MMKACMNNVVTIEEISVDKIRQEEKSIDVEKAADEEAHDSGTPLTVIPMEESNEKLTKCKNIVITIEEMFLDNKSIKNQSNI